LYGRHSVVRATFAEANGVLEPLLGAPLEQLLFQAPGGLEELERRLLESDLAQPVLVTASVSMFRLLLDFGLRPAMLAGHSLGEYSALAAAGVVSFPDALQAAYVRGREFRRLSQSSDPGRMAVVAAAAPDVEPILSRVRGYLAIANRNCSIQTVVSGATSAVSQAVSLLEAQGIECRMLPIAGAFHSAVASAIEGPMAEVLGRLTCHAPVIPLLSSVDNDFYAGNDDIGREVRERLLRQLSHPVDFIGVVRQLYATGARLFVEVGPKKALSGFVSDILGGLPHRSLFANHPKFGEIDQLNRVLAQFFVMGSRFDEDDSNRTSAVRNRSKIAISVKDSAMKMPEPKIVFSGAAVGLPGKSQRVFSDNGFRRLLAGHSMIDPVPVGDQDRMVDKNMLKVVKSGNGDSYFQKVEDRQGVIRLAGQYGRFDLKEDYGLDFDWLNGADVTDRLAVAAGIECLNDAGIPLQRVFRKTSKGTEIPDGWALPAALQADTAVLFASIYAGLDNFLDEVDRYYRSKYGSAAADGVRAEYFKRLEQAGSTAERWAADRWFVSETQRLQLLEGNGEYGFNRNLVKDFCCKANSLFAQLIRARGPNVHVDSACASQAVALALAEDMLRSGRARRVIVLSADVITSSRLLEWFGASFLAVGAAASDEHVTDAALPFDRRRHGLILGSGASAVMLETEEAVRARGMQPIAELLGTHASNSAFHMTRIDAAHVAEEMRVFMERIERTHGLSREELAPKTMFMSHETYTPARGGSAQAEVKALKAAFGSSWREVLVSNTKGMTGHCQGAGIENVAALRSLQYGQAPPVVNLEEQDPEFEGVRFSQGGKEELDYALGFSAGFGSQLAMFMLKALCRDENRIQNEESYRAWISESTGLHDAETERINRILRVRETIQENRSYHPPVTAVPSLETPSLPVPGEPVQQIHEAPQGASPSLPPPQTSAGEVAAASLHLPNQPVADEGPAHALPTTAALQSRATAASPDEVLEVILSLVEEKTGYEREYLDLDLDLEADLGIDTIKQAQILGLIRENYDLPREEGVRLKDFPTLRHAFNYMANRLSATGAATQTVSGSAGGQGETRQTTSVDLLEPTPPAPTPSADGALSARPEVDTTGEILDVILSLVEEKTGYEREFLDLDLDLEADLGIDTIKQAQILGLVRDKYNLPREEGVRLKDFPTLRHVVSYIAGRVQSPAQGLPKGSPESQPSAPAPAAISLMGSNTGVTAPASPLLPADDAVPIEDEIREVVLSLVEEKTGYEREYLDLDLDLEADLGIDTIKQAQILGLIRDRYSLEREEGIRLKDFPTLRHVIGYILKRVESAVREAVRPVSGAQPAPPDEESEGDSTGSPAWTMLRRSVVKLKQTPLPDSSTRLRLLPGHSVVLTDDGLGIASALKKRLEEYGIKAVLLDAAMPGYDERRHGSEREEPEAWQELVDQVAGVTRPVQGVIHLAPLAAEAAVSVKSLAQWRMSNTRETRACFLLAKEMQEELIKSPPSAAFFCAVTALGGDLGLDTAPGRTRGMVQVTHGGVSGLVKTLALELPGTSVKVVDFDAGEARRKPGKLAALLFQEIVAASPDVEVAYKEGRRYLPCLVDAPLDLGSTAQVELDPSSVVVLFGGGRGITAEIAKDLAASFRCHLVLLGLTELDDDAPQFAALSPEERAKLRKGLFEELRKKDPRLTPAQMDAVFQRKVRGAEIHNNMEAIRAQGGSPEYRVCDVRDPRDVQSRLNEIFSRFGRLDGIVFGAGIIEDKLLEDKSRRSFDRVFDSKADGAFNLFHALRAARGRRPKFLALFASIAGRFGNRGQIDYSAANALLDKFPLLVSSEMPGTRCFSIDWTAWEEVGLPARSGLVQLMKEQGMDVISPPEGAEAFRNELLFGSATEMIYAGNLPGLADGWLREGRLPAGEVRELPTHAPLLDIPDDYARGARLKVRKTLHPGTDPWLLDHVINGVPVLPGVIGIEMMAEAGRLLFPDFHFVGLDDLEIRLAVKILKERPARLIVEGQAHTTRRRDERKVRVRIDSEFVDPRGKKQTRQHYEAVVVLNRTAPERPHSSAVPVVGMSAELSLVQDVIYGRNHYLPHGPAFQVLQSIQVLDEKSAIGRVAPVSESALFPKLNGYRLATTPLLREAGFQVAGLWAILKPGILSLPSGCRQLRHFGSPPENARLLARATNLRQTEEAVEYDLEILDENGTVYDLMRQYRAVPVASIAEE
jgi:3-oxoacyl-(acyl-carrier-protein) synthase/NAD(P)-dependent dehydrogenase (short-subunit alcohol dehydrogenase family)/acyl carrier protein